jgi:hypothetical protein
MNQTIICGSCGHHNPDHISFCLRCAKFLRPADYWRGLTLALFILSVVSGLFWGAVLYVELNH